MTQTKTIYTIQDGSIVYISDENAENYPQYDLKYTICLSAADGMVLQCGGVIMGKQMYLTDESQISNYVEVEDPLEDDELNPVF